MNNNTSIFKQLSDDLLDVEIPGRYVGGEFGSMKPLREGLFTAGICFPDLYEIGMSNQAVKILYDLVNRSPLWCAQRVFAPAPDFSRLLKKKNLPLFTLEDGIALNNLDLLAISVGYELAATTILSVLDHGNIPLNRKDRSGADTIVIAGGPGMTNPLPLSQFFDAVFIGEAEAALQEILTQIGALKQAGATRDELMDVLAEHPSCYVPGKKRTRRAIDTDFSHRSREAEYFTVPSIKVVQDHGAAEIMRGCPNGCRFCHAGILYRPFRESPAQHIFRQVDHFVFDQGYDKITLSSLSTGDYHGLQPLVKGLDRAFGEGHVSFSLPSLKIDSFTLDLLEDISQVRKSGITFAVETPTVSGQRALNKEVSRDKVLEILHEAKKRGWRLAKFYFMIGLPGSDTPDIADEIIEYISVIEKEAKINLNVNIGTFIPKPHTPFQWARQFDESSAREIFYRIKDAFRKNRFVKVSYHDPFISTLEGIISRGDERVGDLIESAYRKGALLDPWDDHLKKDAWLDSYAEASWDVMEVLRERSIDEPLPWDVVHLGASKGFLKREYQRALDGDLTDICTHPCQQYCGTCSTSVHPVIQEALDPVELEELAESYYRIHEQYYHREEGLGRNYVVKFTKLDRTRFLSHINMMKIFERAFRRSSIPVSYSQGYNPKPKIDFAHPLSLGVESEGEYLLFQTVMDEQQLQSALAQLNDHLPEGIRMLKVLPAAKSGKFSLMAQYGGAEYILEGSQETVQDVLGTPEHLEYLPGPTSGTTIIRLLVSPGKPDIFKLTDDKYGFIKTFHPKRLETLSTEGSAMDQASFLA